ncbi:twin-arginine translocase TatA/TatE family subunit [Halorhodospira neutriphila]|uniref:Sec-independent protein translocase protein TatA n=1 Tax=Halorhodospira neutriphila TaxID=168379 RepID=A0ABS1E7N2_9GAMM|nr:twin-arginine translocase TatA/TatE family subunit [Halorhodospira neutriphila]MBK1726973.1 hypothetical protein [Halorhodospira neutriphila]
MGFNIWSLLIILAIVLLLFGTKKLRNIGGDLGGAIRGFKESMREGEQQEGAGEPREGREDEEPAPLEHREGESPSRAAASEASSAQERDRSAS